MIAAAAAVPCLVRVAAAICLFAVPLASGAQALQRWTGGPAPPLALKTLAGEDVRLGDFRGRTVIVNFWATWCAPCMAEMPSLQRLRDRFAGEGVEVIAVNYQENVGRIRPFVDRLQLTFPVVRDHDGSARMAWNVRIFPSSFVIAPDQRIAWWASGEIDWDDARVESQIRNLH